MHETLARPKNQRNGLLAQMGYVRDVLSKPASIQTQEVSFVRLHYCLHDTWLTHGPPTLVEMEDYSEYESVNSESEQPADPADKRKKTPKDAKTKAEIAERKEPTTKIVKQSSFKESAASQPKPKQAPTGGTKRKTLDSFFKK